MSGSWSMIVTTNDKRQLVTRFLQRAAKAGCQQVFLFVDKAPDYNPFLLPKTFPFCLPIVTDERYWKQTKSSPAPAIHRRRQIHNARLAQLLCSTEWLIHLDIDESVVAFDTRQSVSSILAQSKEPYIRLTTAEQCFLRFDSWDAPNGGHHYRIQLDNSLLEEAVRKNLLEEGSHRWEKLGCVGHKQGKYFFRTSSEMVADLHRPKLADGQKVDEAIPDSRLVLLHDEPGSFSRWVDKYSKRAHDEEDQKARAANDPSKAELINLFSQLANEGTALKSLFRELYSPPSKEVSFLMENKSMLRFSPKSHRVQVVTWSSHQLHQLYSASQQVIRMARLWLTRRLAFPKS